MSPPIPSGTAALHVAKVRDRSTVISSWSRSPLALLTPRSRGESVWAYISSYGGGMVQGDETRLSITLDTDSRCFLSTQASTKIYRNPSQRACSHVLNADLAHSALLVLAPDPVQCFADSAYDQRQTFNLSDTASLILVDWISGGRSARGERWTFSRYSSRNQIYRNSKAVLIDSLLLESESSPMKNRFRTGRFNCLATVVILGPQLNSFAAGALASIAERPITRSEETVAAASALHEGAILRFAGQQIETVGRAIQAVLSFVPSLLQGDPWERKW